MIEVERAIIEIISTHLVLLLPSQVNLAVTQSHTRKNR